MKHLFLALLFCASTAVANFENFRTATRVPGFTPDTGVCKLTLEAAAAADGTSDFLNSFPVIRVGVVHAPGFGHQMSSVHLIGRLRDLGYHGEIQVIYANESAEKLGALMPIFDPKGPAIQRNAERKLTFTSIETFERETKEFPTTALAFLGAEDSTLYQPASKPTKYRVDTLVRLQPANWLNGEQSIESASGKEQSLQDLRSLQHVLTDVNPTNVPAFLSEQLGLPQESVKLKNLESFFAASDQFDTGCFYNAQTTRVFTASRYAEGIALAMNDAPQVFEKGIVIPILSEMSPYNLVNLEKALKETATAADRVDLVDISDPAFSSKFPPAKGRILVLTATELPPPVVQLFFKRGTLPPAISGKYSRNLLLRLGVPFMETTFSDLPKDLPMPPELESILQRSLSDFQFDIDNPQNPRHLPPRGIQTMVIYSVSNRGQAMRETFRNAARVSDPMREDKTVRAIERVRQFLEEKD